MARESLTEPCRRGVLGRFSLRYPGVRGLSARRTGRWWVALPMLAAALLVFAWIAATVPFTAPDEGSHYLRALSITNGRLLGKKVDYTYVRLPPAQQTWTNNDTRAVLVPARLSPPNVVCIGFKPDVRGSCLEETTSGDYPPLPYLLPAAAIGVSHDTTTAIWATRAATALPSLAFLLLAVALLWNGTGWSLLGLLAATTPMVFFASTIMNPSGMQISASLAFAAALIRIARAPAGTTRWTWLAGAASGVVTILSGPIGLEFAVFEIAVFAALLGGAGLRELRDATERRTLQLLSSLSLVGAGLVALVYSRIAGFAPTLRIFPLVHGLHEGIVQLPSVLQGAVGIFGALTIFLPTAAYWLWWLLVLAMVAAALWLGRRRDRAVIVSVTVLALVFPVLFYAWSVRFTGFHLQGREVLPALMLIPLVAGELVCQNSFRLDHRQWTRGVLGGAIGLVAVLQAYAWWYDARMVAGAPGTIRFYAHATWSPPMGWLPWIVAAGLGTAALLAFAVAEGFAGLSLHPARTTLSQTGWAGRVRARH